MRLILIFLMSTVVVVMMIDILLQAINPQDKNDTL